MDALRLLIADDEAVARARLRGLLAREPGIEVVAECRDGAEALEALRRERPDAAAQTQRDTTVEQCRSTLVGRSIAAAQP